MSKISLHVEKPYCTDVIRQMAALSGWVKLINPPPENPFAPGVRIVGRVHLGQGWDGEEAGYVERGAAGAELWYRRVKPLLARVNYHNRVVWELVNEPVVGNAAQINNLERFTGRAIYLMAADGFAQGGIATGSCSEGCPDVLKADLIKRFIAVIQQGAFWAVHEYGWPRMNHPWHTLRYRMVVDQMHAIGLATPRILITECGLDAGAAGQGRRGWRQSGLSEEQYAAGLAWYDAELCHDNYVAQAFVFGCNPEPLWEQAGFGYGEGMIRRIMALHLPDVPAREPLPEDEPATDLATIIEKIRWWLEECQRTFEAGKTERADAIRRSLIQLLYRAENAVKGR